MNEPFDRNTGLTRNRIDLSTGRSIYAFRGMVGVDGIGALRDGLGDLFPIYLYDKDGTLLFNNGDPAKPTNEEMIEVCIIMARRWMRKLDKLMAECVDITSDGEAS